MPTALDAFRGADLDTLLDDVAREIMHGRYQSAYDAGLLDPTTVLPPDERDREGARRAIERVAQLAHERDRETFNDWQRQVIHIEREAEHRHKQRITIQAHRLKAAAALLRPGRKTIRADDLRTALETTSEAP